MWRNWYTRMIQVHVHITWVRVRVPSSAKRELVFVVAEIDKKRTGSLLTRTLCGKISVPAKQESKMHEMKRLRKQTVEREARAS